MSATWITPKIDWQETDFLNFGDVNRIEGNIGYMRETLNVLRHRIPHQKHKNDWDNVKIPDAGDIKRICHNTKQIADHYYKPPKYNRLSEIASTESLNNVDVNDLEDCLRWLHHMFFVLKWRYNTHRVLRERMFTHRELHKFTHKKIKKDGRIMPEVSGKNDNIPVINNPIVTGDITSVDVTIIGRRIEVRPVGMPPHGERFHFVAHIRLPAPAFITGGPWAPPNVSYVINGDILTITGTGNVEWGVDLGSCEVQWL